MVIIRLARFGKKHAPVYRITVADKEAKLSGRFIERIGIYNPQLSEEKSISLNVERYKYWLGVGAKPTERVQSLAKSAKA